MKNSAALVLAGVACLPLGIAWAVPHPGGSAAVHPVPHAFPDAAFDTDTSGRASGAVIADPKRPGIYLEVPEGGSSAQDEMARHYRGLLRGRKSANTVIVENGRIYFRHAGATAVAHAEALRPPAKAESPRAAETSPASSEPLQLKIDDTLAAAPEDQAAQAPGGSAQPGFVHEPADNGTNDLSDDHDPAPSPAPDPMRSDSRRVDLLPQSARRSRIEPASQPEGAGEPPQDVPLRAVEEEEEKAAGERSAAAEVAEPERPAPEGAGQPEARVQIVAGPAWPLAPQNAQERNDPPPGDAYRRLAAALEARGRLELDAGSLPVRWLVLERSRQRVLQPDFAGRRER